MRIRQYINLSRRTVFWIFHVGQLEPPLSPFWAFGLMGAVSPIRGLTRSGATTPFLGMVSQRCLLCSAASRLRPTVLDEEYRPSNRALSQALR